MADKKFTGVDWEDVRIFVALARFGSLSATARALTVTHATVSRRIQSLESALGEKLVERRPEGYLLTQAGARLLSPANEMEAAAAQLMRMGPADGPSGLVRINAPPSLAYSFLVPRLASLAGMHSSLDIDTGTDMRNVSLERRETDVAIRLSRPGDGDVVAKFAVTLGFGFYATERWCEQVSAGAPPAFVGFDEANAHLPEAQWLSQRYPRARVPFRANLQLAQAEAASAGAGIALLPHFIGRTVGGLRPCPLEHRPPSREIWILTRPQDRRNVAIRTVVDFLVERFGQEQALFE